MITDCVLIGPNEEEFGTLLSRHRVFRERNATFDELMRNAVPFQSKALSYMDALNRVEAARTGVDPQLTPFELPNLGPAYLASFLRRRGFGAHIVNDFRKDLPRLRSILEEHPLSAAITTTYDTEHYAAAETVAYIHGLSPATVAIVGGPYIWSLFGSMSGPELQIQLRAIGADFYIVESQGETTLAALLSALRCRSCPPDFIPNLAFFRDGQLIRTPRAPESNSLDLERVDWEGLDIPAAGSMYLRTARGCPFACSFCNYPTMAGKHVTAGLDMVRDQLRWFAENGVERVLFVDDTLNVPLPRFKAMLRMMREEQFGLRWVCFLRCSNTDDETFDLLASAGCMAVYLGIESGDERILKTMNKFADVRRYQDAIRQLHANGIVTFGSFIAGFPGETADSIARTAEFLNEHPTTFFNVQLYYADPLAPIQSERDAHGLRGSHYNWSHATMDWREASAHADSLLLGPWDSIPLPLHAFSIWSIPYLMDHGFTMGRIRDFARLAVKAKRSASQGRPLDEASFVHTAAGILDGRAEVCR
jgi:p-methyltransferase